MLTPRRSAFFRRWNRASSGSGNRGWQRHPRKRYPSSSLEARIAQATLDFPPPDEIEGGLAELRVLVDDIDHHVVELQYRSGSVGAPFAVGLVLAVPTTTVAVVSVLTGSTSLRQLVPFVAALVVLWVFARVANSSMDRLRGDRDLLRWLLNRRLAYLAEIRRLEAEDTARRRAVDLALMAELIEAAQHRSLWARIRGARRHRPQ